MEADEVHLYIIEAYILICMALSAIAWSWRRMLAKQAKFRTDVAQARYLVQVADLICYTAIWFAISVSLSVFNKYFFSYWRGGFDCPASATAAHMCIKTAVAKWLISSRWSPYREEAYPLSWRDTALVVVPIALATAGDVALSNTAFLFISVTLYTIIKSSSLLWILFWALIFGLEKCSFALIGVCVAISFGLACASYGATPVSLIGTALVLGAGALGGLRWALSQRLMMMDDAFSASPLLLVAKIAPWSAVSTVAAALLVDGNRLHTFIAGRGASHADAESGRESSSDWSMFVEGLGFVLIGGVASFFLLLAEVKLLQLTSSLTLGVLGTVKEILQILIAILVFHDNLTAVNLIGLAACITGTTLYHRAKAGSGAGFNGGTTSVGYDPVLQADAELKGFESSGFFDDDEDLSDGWDDTATIEDTRH
mmetsp:Transcript_38110/g.75340  ORF Transcript_38110/g.75340 Transcript_38110/m.75340 type:complete len:427 (-) Transcript_38110:330-1610(-)